MSDIRKAFLQICLPEEDRNYMKFLWWEEYPNKFRVYRHSRVVFGVNCSPYLLAAVIEHHLKNVEGDMMETARIILKSIYVDNCITSVRNKEEYDKFRSESVALFAD